MAADTFTPKLGLLLMGDGNDENTWGANLNAQVIQYLEEAVCGVTSIATTGGTTTLTQAQYRPRFINVTGVLVSDATLVVPNINKGWTIGNLTTGGFAVLVKTSGGTACSVPQSTNKEVICNGANAVGRVDADLIGGSFFHFGTSVPAGAFECDGAAVSRTRHPELFTSIGTTWGAGDGVTTFNIPDLKTAARYLRARNGSFAVGTLQAGTVEAHTHAAGSLAADSAGAHNHGGVSGTESAHTHPSPALTDPGHTHPLSEQVIAGGTVAASSGAGSGQLKTVTATSNTTGITLAANTGAGSSHSHTISSDGAHTHTVSGATASTGSTETRPITAVAMACIRY